MLLFKSRTNSPSRAGQRVPAVTRSLVEGVCEQAVPGVRIDLGVLNNAGTGSRLMRLMAERALQVACEIMIDVAERIIALENAGPVAGAAQS